MNNNFAINQALDRINVNSKVQQVNQSNNTNNSGKDFASILAEKSEIKFSKHAGLRLEDRNIKLSEEQMQRLNQGKSLAGEKNIKNSLVLVDDYAFIVNVPSSTVITAMDKSETKDNVFTNIDGAVIV